MGSRPLTMRRSRSVIVAAPFMPSAFSAPPRARKSLAAVASSSGEGFCGGVGGDHRDLAPLARANLTTAKMVITL